MLLAAIAYVAAGIGPAVLAGTASSPVGVKAWRLTSWLLSLFIFVVHFFIERNRPARRRVAAWVAAGVALGAFGVAALGPLRAHWAEPSRIKLVMLSLVAWPLVTGIPALIVALIGDWLLDRAAPGMRGRSEVT